MLVVIMAGRLWTIVTLILLLVGVAWGQEGPALDLAQIEPQEAFARLGERHSARFELIEGQPWVGREQGVLVTADLRELSFWQAVLKLGEQTGYEPVFRPYGRSEDGRPIIWLHRVDVRGEQTTQPAVAAGPVLLRSREAYVTVTQRMSQVRMVPMQAGVRSEVFLEPGIEAVYVTAVALRASDEEKSEFRRGEGFDPTTPIRAGIGELEYRLDVIKRVPVAVAEWRAQLRIVSAGDTERIRTRISVVPEEAVTRPATAPATRQGAPVATEASLGPYQMGIAPVVVGDREGPDAEPGRRVATVRLSIPRGELDYTGWSRLYGFLVSLPPSLEAGEDVNAWRLGGYAVVSGTDASDPETASRFHVWARFEADPGAPDPEWLAWELPVSSDEQRAVVSWVKPLTIEGQDPATRKAPVAPAEGGRGVPGGI